LTSIHSIINRQLMQWELQRKKISKETPQQFSPAPIVTVSRQLGSRGSYFAERLAEKLEYQRLHRDVIDTICQSSGYRKRIIESIDDKFRNELELMVESMFTGQAVDYHDYFLHLYRIVLSMSQLGGVVLVGRGGNFIIGPNRGFHIRFVAPKDKRIHNLMTYEKVDREEAIKLIENSDAERKEFIKKLFNADINDPQKYDLVINSAYMDIEDLLEVVVKAIKAKFDKLTAMNKKQD